MSIKILNVLHVWKEDSGIKIIVKKGEFKEVVTEVVHFDCGAVNKYRQMNGGGYGPECGEHSTSNLIDN